jgi:cyclophilin family peptidyl-prolyl cis-trans isomerase
MMQRLRSERRFAPILPVARSASDVSIPTGDVSSCDDSSTESYWLSPKSSNRPLGHDHSNNNNTKPMTNTITSSGDKYSLPTWSANPQSPGSDAASSSPVAQSSSVSFPTTTNRSTSSKNLLMLSHHDPHQFMQQQQERQRRISVLLLLGMTVMGLFAMIAPRVTLKQAATQIATFHSHRRDELQRRLTQYERDIQDIENQLSTLDFHYNQQHLGFVAAVSSETTEEAEGEEQLYHERNLSEMSALQQRLKNELAQAQYLKQLVQVVSRNATIEKFGRSDHYVEMELVFPDDRSDGPNRFVIKMASIDLMPHSVNTFLEMVSTGLLDGCSFILNALQVVKAAPLPYDGTSASDKAKAFAQHGLESVSFKEYSHEYPHKMYTVGFAADGSPSFYINTADNSEIHVGDPCFGKVISGFDTIHRLANSPTRNGIWFQHRIGIKSARIIPASSVLPVKEE